jgi:TonB family protein
MPEPTHLSAPLSSRRFNGRLRARAGGIALSALAWAAFLAAFFLVPVLFVESLPARAVTMIIFPQAHVGWGGLPPIKGGGGGIRQAAPPRLHPPVPRPLTTIAPPEPLRPPEDNPAPETWSPGTSDNVGDGGGPGVANGTPGGCAGCSGDGGGPGVPGPGTGKEDPSLVPENHPGLERPRIIPSTRSMPDYPAMARRAQVMGTVELRIVIDEHGEVGQIEVVKSPDQRYGFDVAAIEAVKHWRYLPGRLGGRPVAVEAFVLVEFTLAR